MLPTETRNRLLNDLRQLNLIQSRSTNILGTPSEIWLKADSLFSSVTLQETINYFNDSSSVIKYYSFLRTISKSEVEAFKMLKKIIGDSTKVNFSFEDESGEERLAVFFCSYGI